jgi:anti-anti-sigma factor
VDAPNLITFRDEGGWRIGACRLTALDDLTVLDRLEATCDQELRERPTAYRALDLRGVTFLVTRAIGILVSLHKRQRETGGTLVLCGLDSNVARTLHITRLDRVFEVYADVAALVAARPGGRPQPSDQPHFGP